MLDKAPFCFTVNTLIKLQENIIIANATFGKSFLRRKRLFQTLKLNMTLIQGSYYRRNRLVTRSTCKPLLVTHSTHFTSRSTVSTRLSTGSTPLSFVIVVFQLAVLVFPFLVLVCPFVYPFVVLICPLVVLVCPTVVSFCPFVVFVALSVGLFITHRC